MAAEGVQLTTDGDKVLPTEALPAAQMANCQKLSAVEKDNSALHKNIAEKGNNAYYFAHSRTYEIPAHAKIITGPGLVAGGPPQRLDSPACEPDSGHGTAPVPQAMVVEPASPDAASPQKEIESDAIALKEYSWSDDGAKVKVYVPCDALSSAPAEGLVNSNFESKGFSIDVNTVPRRRFRLDKLNKEIEPAECKVRADATKGRITITLVKKRGGAWYDLISKK